MNLMVKLVFYGYLILFIVACNDSNDSNDSNDTTSETAAALSVESTAISRIYKIHGNDTVIGNADVYVDTKYFIKNLDTGDTVETITADDHDQVHRIALPSDGGNYDIEMQVNYISADDLGSDELTESDTALTFSADNSVVYSDSDGDYELWVGNDEYCAIICEDTSDDGSLATCTSDYYHSSSHYCETTELILEELLETAQEVNSDVDSGSYLCVRAFGAGGEDGDDYKDSVGIKLTDGGDGGHGGLAQTTMLYSDLYSVLDDNTDNTNNAIYLYLGRKGAGTHILTDDPYNDDDLTSEDDDSYEFDALKVLVMAGGGGWGGNAQHYYNGGDGGDGAKLSVSTKSSCSFAEGGHGGKADNSSKYGEGGGTDADYYDDDCTNEDTLYDAAAKGVNHKDQDASGHWGEDGHGGLLYSSSGSWYTSGTLTSLHDVFGDGGYGSHNAHGGGGAGGGGGGYGRSGGGAGGGYAQAVDASVSDGSCDDFDGYSTNSSNEGYVEFIFYN